MSKLIKELQINQDTDNVLFIGGPTASGKTSLAVKVAKEFQAKNINICIISADSRQIYFYMDICSAKPVNRGLELKIATDKIYLEPISYQNIPHYLFDIKFPDEKYTLFDFKKQAEEIISIAHSNNTKVIVAGGTGLYIDALINNYQLASQTTSPEVRSQLEKEYQVLLLSYPEEKAKDLMWEKLKSLDEAEALKQSPQNIYGVIRSLEVLVITDKSKSDLKSKSKPAFEYQLLVLDPPRQDLYDYINARCEEMLGEGLLEETRDLIQRYSLDTPSMSSIGYKQFAQYLNGEITKQKALEDFQKATRNYAKRQLTWFRRYKTQTNTSFIDSYKILKKAPSK